VQANNLLAPLKEYFPRLLHCIFFFHA
jgi:hypothetical protein